MKDITPIAFEGANGTLTAPPNMAHCEDLPVYTDGDIVVSCWQIPFWTRVKLLVSGKICLFVKGCTHPPVYLEVGKFKVEEK